MHYVPESPEDIMLPSLRPLRSAAHAASLPETNNIKNLVTEQEVR